MSWEELDAARKKGDLRGALHAHVTTAKELDFLHARDAAKAHSTIDSWFKGAKGGTAPTGGLPKEARDALTNRGDARPALLHFAQKARMGAVEHQKAGRASVASQGRAKARALERAADFKRGADSKKAPSKSESTKKMIPYKEIPKGTRSVFAKGYTSVKSPKSTATTSIYNHYHDLTGEKIGTTRVTNKAAGYQGRAISSRYGSFHLGTHGGPGAGAASAAEVHKAGLKRWI